MRRNKPLILLALMLLYSGSALATSAAVPPAAPTAPAPAASAPAAPAPVSAAPAAPKAAAAPQVDTTALPPCPSGSSGPSGDAVLSTPCTPEPPKAPIQDEAHRKELKDLLFDSYKKDAWLALSAEEREKVMREILPTMSFNALQGEKLEDAVHKLDPCVSAELAKDEYANFDVATAITACLFKLGYAP